jgi:hypothetical protein
MSGNVGGSQSVSRLVSRMCRTAPLSPTFAHHPLLAPVDQHLPHGTNLDQRLPPPEAPADYAALMMRRARYLLATAPQ